MRWLTTKGDRACGDVRIDLNQLPDSSLDRLQSDRHETVQSIDVTRICPWANLFSQLISSFLRTLTICSITRSS